MSQVTRHASGDVRRYQYQEDLKSSVAKNKRENSMMMQESGFSEPVISVTEVGGKSKIRQIKVTVYTSKGCIFCKEAIEMLREAAGHFSREQLGVEVIESRVDDKPELVESLDIVAVPTILVGKSRVIGLPRLEELESLIHEAMFFPTGL
ncbi:MAG: hypothetical protein C4K49_11475 [Candidatus Thorarchaeota archaeon]|nr:MAG: hypothetical protein C4K49_11475 [Candidatus Thorarchaeota archaeon]